jgi:aspartate-semialdehyde dehydrogenase
MKYNISLLGAHNIVANNILKAISELYHNYNKIFALSRSEFLGKKISFGDDEVLVIDDFHTFDFSKIDIAIICDLSIKSQELDSLLSHDIKIIDLGVLFSLKNASLGVFDVNSKNYNKRIIVARPFVSAIGLLLSSINNIYDFKRVNATILNSVSNFEKEGMDELYNQTKSKFMQSEIERSVFDKQIAFNILLQEDQGALAQIQSLCKNDIIISTTQFISPVFIGDVISLHMEFDSEIDLAELKEIISENPWFSFVQNITPIDIVNESTIFIANIGYSDEKRSKKSIDITIMLDNLFVGYGVNIVEILNSIII